MAPGLFHSHMELWNFESSTAIILNILKHFVKPLFSFLALRAMLDTQNLLDSLNC